MLFPILFSSTGACMTVVQNGAARECIRASVSNPRRLSRSLSGKCNAKVGKVQSSSFANTSTPLPCTLLPQNTSSSLYIDVQLQKAKPDTVCRSTSCTCPIETTALPLDSSSDATISLGAHSRRCHETTAYNSRCTCLIEVDMIALHVMIGSVCQRMDQFFAASRALALPRLGAASGEQPAPSP